MNLNPILTEKEAEDLIRMVKTTLVEHINFPGRNQKIEFNIQGTNTRDIFSISIFRSKIDFEKYNYSIRIAKNGVVLLSLDINRTGKHRNPDGNIIKGSHWHIYTEEYGRQYAVPAEDIDSSDFVENTLLFFHKINLIKPPIVIYQSELNL